MSGSAPGTASPARARARHSRALGLPAPAAIALFAVLLAAVLVATSGCVQREADTLAASTEPDRVPVDQLGDVVLEVGDQKGGTQALLDAAGQLDGLPYRINWSTFTSGPPQVEALTAGKIDFAVTGNTPPLFGAASGARIKIVSTTDMSGTGDKIIAPEGKGIGSIAELKGKKVAVGKGTSAHGHLLLQLQKAGMSIDDIEPVYLQPAEASAAFDRGDVDAWAIWDPYTAIAETSAPVRTLASADQVSNGGEFGLASLDALADAKKNTALADLVTRIAKASNWAAENTDEWATQYSRIVDVPLEAAKLSQSRRSDRKPAPADGLEDSEQKLADAFSSAGIIKPFEVSDFVDDRYTEDLQPYFGG